MHSPGYGTAEAVARAYGHVATLYINNRISWCGYAGPCQAKRINLKEIDFNGVMDIRDEMIRRNNHTILNHFDNF